MENLLDPINKNIADKDTMAKGLVPVVKYLCLYVVFVSLL